MWRFYGILPSFSKNIQILSLEEAGSSAKLKSSRRRDWIWNVLIIIVVRRGGAARFQIAGVKSWHMTQTDKFNILRDRETWPLSKAAEWAWVAVKRIFPPATEMQRKMAQEIVFSPSAKKWSAPCIV